MALSEHVKRKNRLFNELRMWAYQHVVAYKQAGGSKEAWAAKVRQKAYEMNHAALAPTKESSAFSVAARVAEFSFDIYAMDRNSTEYRQMQSERGQRGARMRWGGNELAKEKAYKMRTKGICVRKIAKTLGVTPTTIYTWLKSMPVETTTITSI